MPLVRRIIPVGGLRAGLNTSGAPIPERRIVVEGALVDAIALAVDTVTARYVGVTIETVPAGIPGTLQTEGKTTIEAGSALARNVEVGADAQGRAVALNANSAFAVGRTVTSCLNAGDIVEVELVRRRLAFHPGQISAALGGPLSAWLRVANATSDVNGISSVPDFLNTNPATQSVNARKPVIENSANGLPCMRFQTNDVLVWPITPQSSASLQAGWGMWVKPDSSTGGQRIIYAGPGTNGASGFKLSFQMSVSQWKGEASADGATTTFNLSGSTAPAANWRFLTLEYDGTAPTDAEKLVISFQGVRLTGALSGAAILGALFPATGNLLIGNGNDGVATLVFNGRLGPNLYAWDRKQAGATLGLLTTETLTALMNYQAPT